MYTEKLQKLFPNKGSVTHLLCFRRRLAIGAEQAQGSQAKKFMDHVETSASFESSDRCHHQTNFGKEQERMDYRFLCVLSVDALATMDRTATSSFFLVRQ